MQHCANNADFQDICEKGKGDGAGDLTGSCGFILVNGETENAAMQGALKRFALSVTTL